MRLNAINPSDNPMEELLFCFGSDSDSGSGGSDDTGFDDGDVGGVDVGGKAQTPNASGGFGDSDRGGDSGGDVSQTARQQSLMTPQQRAEAAYINQAVQTFQDPNYLSGLSPMAAAQGAFNYATTPRADSVTTDREFGIDVRDMGAGFGGALMGDEGLPVATAPVVPSFAPNLANQPLTVGGKVAVMPYESFQRSPQQMFGYGGLTAAPYSPNAISFQGGLPAQSYDPLGGSRISQFDMGRAPTPAGVPDNRSFFDRVAQNLGGMFDRQEQRAGVFDPRTGTFQQFDGQTTLQKTSDNMLADFVVNTLNPFTGLTGFADTKTYQPLAGGENLQYSNFSGGLLSGMIGENLVPFSELEARNAQTGGDGGGSDQPFIIPTEVAQTDPETGEPTAFPTFAPRRFEYQPYVGQFYTIPSRFTRPVSLLG